MQAYAEEATNDQTSGNEEESLEDPMVTESFSSIDSTNLYEEAAQMNPVETIDHGEPVQTDEGATGRQDPSDIPSYRYPSGLRNFLSSAANRAKTVASIPYLGIKRLKNMRAHRLGKDPYCERNQEGHPLRMTLQLSHRLRSEITVRPRTGPG